MHAKANGDTAVYMLPFLVLEACVVVQSLHDLRVSYTELHCCTSRVEVEGGNGVLSVRSNNTILDWRI